MYIAITCSFVIGLYAGIQIGKKWNDIGFWKKELDIIKKYE